MPKHDDIRKGLGELLKTPPPPTPEPAPIRQSLIPAEHLGLWICTDTGEIGKPTSHIQGSFLIELLLWLFMLLPGLIYSCWRLGTRKPAINGNTNIIKIDTPRGRKLYAEFHG